MQTLTLPHNLDRRRFLERTTRGLSSLALASLLNNQTDQALGDTVDGASNPANPLPHFAAKAKRVIYMLQSGAPSQVDLFDYKPTLKNLHLTELPDSVRQSQR